MRKRFGIAALTAIMIWSTQAAADPTIYTDRAAFDNAAGPGLSFESFESNPQAGPTVTYGDLTFVESGGTTNFFTHTAINTYFTSATTDGQHSIWYDDNNDSVSTLTIAFSGPVTALGLDITTSANSTVAIGGDIVSSIDLTAHTPSFLGVIDMMSPFGAVTFSASSGPEVGFDAVSFGTAIPAPGAAFLGLIGLASLGWLKKRLA